MTRNTLSLGMCTILNVQDIKDIKILNSSKKGCSIWVGSLDKRLILIASIIRIS